MIFITRSTSIAFNLLIIVLVTLISNNFSVLGQTEDLEKDKFDESEEQIYDSRAQLKIGWFLPNIKSNAQLNGSSGKVGANVNLETAFDLPTDRKLFRIEGLYRFNNTSSADFYYYALNRSGTSISKDSLIFGSIIINIGAEINSLFNLSLFGGRYHFSILNNKNFESGLSAGISFLDIDLAASIKLNDYRAEESYNTLLFLPVIGFFNRVRFWEDFTFRNHINLFALDIERYDGVLFDFALSLEYDVLKDLSVGVANDVFTLDVNFNTGESGRIQYNQRGFLLFALLKF